MLRFLLSSAACRNKSNIQELKLEILYDLIFFRTELEL